MLFALTLFLAVSRFSFAAVVNIPQPNGNVLTYPAQCKTQTDHNQIRTHCSRWAAPDGLANNAGRRGWSVDECETHYCNSLTLKAPAQLLPQCTQSTCIKYKLGIRAGLETWLNPRLIKIFGTKMTNPVPYVFPYLMFKLYGTTIQKSIKERFLVIEFSAPDWGDLTQVQIFFDRQQKYQHLQPKEWFLNTGVEYVWMSKGHYNYWWNIGGQRIENHWILPRTVSKEWRYNDLIDPRPVCYGRGLCGDPRKQYGYALAYPSYQERWYMSEINAIRNNPRGYYKKGLNNRDNHKIKCGIDGSHPYFFDMRMGQGARFKAWETGAGLCPASDFTCPQHVPWICAPARYCASVAGRVNIMAKDPCINNFCQANSEAPIGSAVSWNADGFNFRFKAEGLGQITGLIESDPGRCGGVLGNIRYRTSIGWFPNVKKSARTWQPFSGSTVVVGPFPKQNTWWPNNAVYMKYNPIPTGSHKVIATKGGRQTVRYLVTYWSRTNVHVRNDRDVFVVIRGKVTTRHRMTLLVGDSKYGTYVYEATYTDTKSKTCMSYYFEVFDSNDKRHLMPESGLYVYQTWGVDGCTGDFKVDMCPRVGFNFCGDNGKCKPANGRCECSNNYKGNKCQNAEGEPACANVDCGPFGTCKETSGQCECTNGYTGPSCGIPSMGSLGAGDHGTLNNQMFENPVDMATLTGSGEPVPGGSTGDVDELTFTVDQTSEKKFVRGVMTGSTYYWGGGAIFLGWIGCLIVYAAGKSQVCHGMKWLSPVQGQV